MNNESFNKYIEQAIKENWERIALSDFDGVSYHYKDIARKIAKIHLLLESAEIKKGDKIAICGKNSAHWAVAFFAAITYGAVPVPILHEFKADNIHHIVNHSEAKLLLVGDIVWEDLNETLMKNLKGIFLLNDFSLLRSKSEKLTDMRNRLNEYFGKKYPARFTRCRKLLRRFSRGTRRYQLHLGLHRFFKRSNAPLPQFMVQCQILFRPFTVLVRR